MCARGELTEVVQRIVTDPYPKQKPIQIVNHPLPGMFIVNRQSGTLFKTLNAGADP